MTCAALAPQTLDDMLAAITRCATAAGGPGWAASAMLGAEALAVVQPSEPAR